MVGADEWHRNLDCDLEYIGPIGSEPMDIWRCKAHRYNFFSKRGQTPEACPVKRGKVPEHPYSPSWSRE
jgi:hypothetical protein